MKMSKALHTRMQAAKKTDTYWMDSAKLDFALAIEAKRKEFGKSYTDLATTLNTSNAYISKVFRGDANLTIESMVKLARSVGCNIDLNLKDITEDLSIKNVSAARINSTTPMQEQKSGTQHYPYESVLSSAANDDLYQNAA